MKVDKFETLKFQKVEAEFQDKRTLYVGFVKEKFTRHDIVNKMDELAKKLKDQGIATRPFFYPMNLQPVFNNMGLFTNESYPVAEKISNKGFYIPCGLGISNLEIKEVADKLKQILLNYN